MHSFTFSIYAHIIHKTHEIFCFRYLFFIHSHMYTRHAHMFVLICLCFVHAHMNAHDVCIRSCMRAWTHTTRASFLVSHTCIHENTTHKYLFSSMHAHSYALCACFVSRKHTSPRDQRTLLFMHANSQTCILATRTPQRASLQRLPTASSLTALKSRAWIDPWVTLSRSMCMHAHMNSRSRHCVCAGHACLVGSNHILASLAYMHAKMVLVQVMWSVDAYGLGVDGLDGLACIHASGLRVTCTRSHLA